MRLLDFRLARGATARGAVLAGLVFLSCALVVFLKLTAQTSIPTPGTIRDAGPADDHPAFDSQLIDAIRDGNSIQVQNLLEQGADPNARDEAGDTALMRAALYADTELMRLLVARGAKASARGQDGSSSLLRAVHDIDK